MRQIRGGMMLGAAMMAMAATPARQPEPEPAPAPKPKRPKRQLRGRSTLRSTAPSRPRFEHAVVTSGMPLADQRAIEEAQRKRERKAARLAATVTGRHG